MGERVSVGVGMVPERSGGSTGKSTYRSSSVRRARTMNEQTVSPVLDDLEDESIDEIRAERDQLRRECEELRAKVKQAQAVLTA